MVDAKGKTVGRFIFDPNNITPGGQAPDSAAYVVRQIGGTWVTLKIGDFNSGYTVKSTSHSERGPTGVPRDSTTTIEAKWLGACKADQKAGDIMMPGGMKMNIKDMEKLKALIPKQLPK